MEQAVSAVKLLAWPGWGVVGPTAFLAALLAAILAVLLPFPNQSLGRQLSNHHDRLDLRTRFGLSTPLDAYKTAMRRFNVWLGNWFGPAVSWQSFERCLAIAFIYPVSIFLLTQAINGVKTNQISELALFIFAVSAIIGAYLLYLLLDYLQRLASRLWGMIGGDADMAPELLRGALGVLAVVTAFAIAFAIATVISSELYGPGPVALAVIAAFALAFGLAVAFAFAGLGAFALAVVVVAAILLAFASEFAFILLLFFVMIPIVNAGVDWLSWAGTRFLLQRAETAGEGRQGMAMLVLLLIGTGLIAAVLILLLTVLLANALGLLNAGMALFSGKGFALSPLLRRAAEAPWTDALFITGMLLTPLLPVFTHLTIGLTGILARYTPGAAQKALLITEHPDVAVTPEEAGRVESTFLLARLWYIPAVLAVFVLFVVIGTITHFMGLHVSKALLNAGTCAAFGNLGPCGG